MKILRFCLVFFYILHAHGNSTLNRLDFPPSFVFGAGTSAYQVEGAAAEDGRTPSVWDTFTHQENDFAEGTGDITSDQYHKYKDDVKLMHTMGLDAYRFSISWSRLIPDGHGAVNPKGLKYYNNLIDELVSHGIEPHVTLSHYDLPQVLQDEYKGYQSTKFIEDFSVYADFCFNEFGDRVKYWITFNQPNTEFGFTTCFTPFAPNCSNGDLKTEAYLPAHHILLSHAAAVRIYRTKYQEKQKGNIGITFMAIWNEPLTNSPLDVNEAEEKNVFRLGWFLDPLLYGRYPAIMRKSLGSQLPNLTKEESTQIKGSFDFIGLNNYFGNYVQGSNNLSTGVRGFAAVRNRDYRISGLRLKGDYQHLPTGMALQKLLQYLKLKYKNPPIFIHENGYGTSADDESLDQNDAERIFYLEANIQSLHLSMRYGSNVKGYFVWSFLDCFELFGGYDSRYGLYGVDFGDKNRTRYARKSAHWYANTFLGKPGGNLEAHSYTS